jgi:hypothetical protein
MPIRDNRYYLMSINSPHYNIDNNIGMYILNQDSFNCNISIYNDTNDSCVSFKTSRDKLKGLADFIYETINDS